MGRELTAEFMGQGVCNARSAAIVEMAVPGGCFPKKTEHQLGAVHSAREGEAVAAA